MTTEAASVRPCQCIWEGPTSDPRLVSPCTGHLLWMQDERHKTKRELSAANEHIAELEAAIVGLNNTLNELWGRDDQRGVAVAIGTQMLDKIMNAQNLAFSLTGIPR